jgi:excisionase family DNA binding protein
MSLNSTAAPFVEPITVTVAQTKQLTGLGHNTVYVLIKQGKLDVVKVGARTLIKFDSIKRLLATGTAIKQPAG